MRMRMMMKVKLVKGTEKVKLMKER